MCGSVVVGGGLSSAVGMPACQESEGRRRVSLKLIMADDVFRLILIEGRIAFCTEGWLGGGGGGGQGCRPTLAPLLCIQTSCHDLRCIITQALFWTQRATQMFGHLLAALWRVAREMVEKEEEEEHGGNRRCRVKLRGRGVPVPAG